MASAKTRSDIEQLLTDKGVGWEFFEEFDASLIDVPKSLSNQARIGQPINSEQVDAYEEGMRRGDVFPAIVLYKSGNKYVVIDGNHRVAAALKTGYKLGAYVVSTKTPAQVIVMLTYEANTKHGLPTAQKERARHAVYLMENAGETQKNAAARMNIPTHVLASYYAGYRSDQRAHATGVPPAQWRELHFGSRKRLNALPDDEVFRAAADVAFKLRLTAPEIDDLVVTLRTLGSSKEQLVALARYASDNSDRLSAVATGEHRPRRHRQGGPRQSLRSSMYMLESLVGDKRQQLLDAITPIEAAEELRRFDKALGIAVEVRTELEKKAKAQ